MNNQKTHQTNPLKAPLDLLKPLNLTPLLDPLAVPYKSLEDPSTGAVDPIGHLKPLDSVGPPTRF